MRTLDRWIYSRRIEGTGKLIVMTAHSLYFPKPWPIDWKIPYADFLRQAAAVVTEARTLDEACSITLDACSASLGFLYPSLVLLESLDNQIVGRLISSPQTTEAVRQAASKSDTPIDGLLGPRRSVPSTVRHAIHCSKAPADGVAFRLDMKENLVVRVFLERNLQLTPCYYDLVRPYLLEKEAEAIQRALGTESLAVMPLLIGERCLGVIVVGSIPGRSFDDSDSAALGLVAAQAALAVENDRLQHSLSESEQQVTFLLKAIIDAHEEERERICLDIHDGVAQTLAPAFQYLQTIDGPELPEALRASVRKAGGLVKTAIREARDVISSLRPASLDTLGLVATLRYEMDELRDQTSWQIEFDADQVRFPKMVETALYRIIREAITNVTKHARSTHLAIRIKQVDHRVVVEIQDDGVGFDFAASECDAHRKGVGLLSMRKRVELLSGRFHLISTTERGTLVHVEVPLPDPTGQAAATMQPNSLLDHGRLPEKNQAR